MTSPLVPIRIKTCGSNLIDAAEHYPFLGILTGYRDPVLRGFADQTATTTTTTATPPTTHHPPLTTSPHFSSHAHFARTSHILTSTPRCLTKVPPAASLRTLRKYQVNMSDLAALEDELAQALEFVATCKEALEIDPDDQDVKTDMLSFEQQIPLLKSQIAALKAKSAPALDAVAGSPKYDMSKHPKYHTPGGDTRDVAGDLAGKSEEHRVSFNVGDVVQAKYSADKSWYPATIVSKTGSSSDPVYTVNFKGYDEKEQKRKHEVRPAENKKRKAEGDAGASNGAKKAAAAAAAAVPPPPPPPAPVHDGTVISGAPSIDASLVKKYEPSKVSDGPTRMAPAPKKLKGNKTLEKSKNSWNDWQKSGPKKPAIGGASKLKKDSQFRTPDLPNAKGKYILLRRALVQLCILTFP